MLPHELYRNLLKPDSEQTLPIVHPARRLKDVINDILTKKPEESFCFLNERALKRRAEKLKALFLPDYPEAVIAYAVKANSRRRILQLLVDAGITAFDCASPTEIMEVKKVDATSDIFYNHPVKRACDITAAAEMRVKHYTVQTEKEVAKVLASTNGLITQDMLELAVRMQTLNEDADIDLSVKFGASEQDAIQIAQTIRDQTDAAVGISTNTGSQNRNPITFADAVRKIGNVVEQVPEVGFVNLGGGFPVKYFESDRFEINEYFEIINNAIRKILGKIIKENKRIIIEPGRALIADAVDLVIPVLSVEQRNGGLCAYINDGVFTSFSDYPLHRWQYNFRPINLHGKTFSTHLTPFTLFGRTCDSGDAIKNVQLPENLDEGDYLWVASAGAYLDSQTSHFNGFAPPSYISYNI